jgi:hypothetical protein
VESDIPILCSRLHSDLGVLYGTRLGSRGNGHRPVLAAEFSGLCDSFVFWSLLYAVVSGGPLFFRNVPIHTLIGSQFGGFGFSGQYYFIILFQVILLFPFFRNALDSRTKVLGAIATGFLFDWVIVYGFSQHELLEKIGYRVVVYWIGYVALGIACARGYLKVRTLWPALAGCVVMALALVELRVLPDLCVYIAPSVTIGRVFSS